MPPSQSLPYNPSLFDSSDSYIDSLLELVVSNDLLRTLCGGIHILDFFTSEQDVYSTVLPSEWRDFFAAHDVMDLLDLFMREDLPLQSQTSSSMNGCVEGEGEAETGPKWRSGPAPPSSLVGYILTIRKHLLDRGLNTNQCQRNRAMKPTQKLARHVAVGMTVKKVHEVGLFASYIDRLASTISLSSDDPSDNGISHLVDFGSGQNYLGRALASEPYHRNIVAVESKIANAVKAKEFDVMAKLAERDRIMRNKKAFRAGLEWPEEVVPKETTTPPPEPVTGSVGDSVDGFITQKGQNTQSKGKIQYIDHRIQDGDLTEVISRLPETGAKRNLMVMSLHSCGNLVHHGLRSLVMNPEVRAVAMVGCCYNLLTERLGPATYKYPDLRPTRNARLEREGEARDPHGFPMSKRLCECTSTARPGDFNRDRDTAGMSLGKGMRLNITSRMMAVQAPQNWGDKDTEAFFTRHFYRALLQKVFLDQGVVGPPKTDNVGAMSASGHSSGGTPLILGSLKKACYADFVVYVRGAVEKLTRPLYANEATLHESNAGLCDDQHNVTKEIELAKIIQDRVGALTDAQISQYEQRYRERKKDLSVTWSLMAFSAGVLESAIVVDRFIWLKEQEAVTDAWVESVFDFRWSPRNLVVVGVKG